MQKQTGARILILIIITMFIKCCHIVGRQASDLAAYWPNPETQWGARAHAGGAADRLLIGRAPSAAMPRRKECTVQYNYCNNAMLKNADGSNKPFASLPNIEFHTYSGFASTTCVCLRLARAEMAGLFFENYVVRQSGRARSLR